MSDPRESDAVVKAAEIIGSQDDREFEIEIRAEHYFQLSSWFLKLNEEREKVFTNPYVKDPIPAESYREHLFPRFAEKLLQAPKKGLSPSGKVSLNISYREIDAIVLSSFYADPEFEYVTDEYRGRIHEGNFDISIAYHAKAIKHILLDIMGSFVKAGGKDRFGYLEALKRIASMKVESFYNWEDGSVDLIETEDDDLS